MLILAVAVAQLAIGLMLGCLYAERCVRRHLQARRHCPTCDKLSIEREALAMAWVQHVLDVHEPPQRVTSTSHM